MADSNQSNNGSFFRDLITATPAAVGVGYAFKNRAKFNMATANAPVATQKAISAAKATAASVNVTRDLSFIDPKFISTLSGGQAIREAWEQAVKATSPFASDVLKFTDPLTTRQGPEMLSAIEQTLGRNQSLYMTRTYLKFRRNMEVLSNQVAVFGKIPTTLSVGKLKLGPELPMSVSQLPTGLGDFWRRVVQGGTVSSAGVTFASRAGWADHGFGLYKFKFRMPGDAGDVFEFNVPFSKDRITVEGATQSTRRLAYDAAIFDPRTRKIGSTLSRHDFFALDFEKSIVPGIASGKYKNTFQVKKAISELYERDISAFEATPNDYPSQIPASQKHYEATRSKTLDIFVEDVGSKGTSVFRRITEDEQAILAESGGLTPGTSAANLAKGRLTTLDPSKWFMTPPAVDFSRSPSQAVRDWVATPDAVKAMMDSGSYKRSIFETQAWRKEMGRNKAPWLDTLYLDPDAHRETLERLGIGAGESGVIRDPATLAQLQVQRKAQPLHMKELSEGIAARIKSGDPFIEGESLGWSTTGEPVSYRKGMKLERVIKHWTESEGDLVQLHYKEIKDISLPEKYFHHQKTMEALLDRSDVEREVGKKTRQRIHLDNVQRIMSMDALRKSKHLLNNQLITSLHKIVSEQRSKTFISERPRLAAFIKNPVKFADELTKANLRNGRWHQEGFVKGMVSLATEEAALSGEEFANFGGALPYVYKDKLSDLIPDQYLSSLKAGVAGGFTQSVFHDSMTAGGIGTIEPRFFDLLTAGQYGPMGGEIAEDFAQRLAVSNPEKLLTFEELGKTIVSTQGLIKPEGAVKTWNIAEKIYDRETFQHFLESGGGWIEPGGGMSDIYVPGAKELGIMSPHMTPGKNVVVGDIAGEFHSLTQQLSTNYYKNGKRLELAQASEALGEFLRNIQEYQAPTGKGMGAVTRGELLGSRYLKGVTQLEGVRAPDLWTVVAGRGHIESMYKEMLSTGLYDEAEIETERQLALKGKGTGVLLRHPGIGPYSATPVNVMASDAITSPHVMLPSKTVDIRLAGEMASSAIQLSPMVGMGGDLDADDYNLVMASPKTAKSIRQNFLYQNNEYTQRYIENMIRMNIVEAKAPKSAAAAGMTINELMAASARQLGTANRSLPMLSVELGAARGAVSKYMTGREASDAMFLLNRMEQVPVSGKFMDPARVYKGEMDTLFRTMRRGFKVGDMEGVYGAVASIFGFNDQSPSQAQRLLTENVSIAEGAQKISQEFGVPVSSELAGVNLRSTLKGIGSAMSAAEKAGELDNIRLRAARKVLTPDLVSSYAADLGLAGQKFSKVSSAIGYINNMKTMIGETFIKNKKAIGFGFVGSLAIAAALASPEDTIGPGAGLNASVDMPSSKSLNRITPETTSPPQSVGQPTIPNTMSRPRTMISPNSQMSRTRVRANGPRSNAQNFGQDMSNNSSMNINIRDNSSILNVEKIMSKIL